jgi:hypothetical protein
MTDITLDRLLDLAGKHAHHFLIEEGARQLAPVFLFLTEGGEGTVCLCPWENDFQKQIMLAGVRAKMREARATRYSFVTEAWFARAPEGMPFEEARKLRASKDPNRQEAVIALATDGFNTKWREWEIKRDWKGKIRDLAPMEIGPEDQFMSPFGNLLGGTA